MSPKLPALRPRCSDPIASQASSITTRSRLRAMRSMGSMSQICPNTWIGSSARVRSVSALSIPAGSRLKVSGSMSTKTGSAFSYRMQFDDATKLNALVTT